jgi:ribosome-associated protein
LTTKKHVEQRGTSADRGRPRIKTSHERVIEGSGARKPRTKTARGASRAIASVSSERLHAPQTRPAPAKGASVPRKFRTTQDGYSPAEHVAWGSVATEGARETATAIAVAALDKKAVGVEILDVAGKVDYADFVVIMTGRSDRHAQALAQGIEEALKKRGRRPIAIEGLHHGSWVLMDFGDVVVHVFQDDARRLYDIEGLWLDARRLPVPVTTPSD